MKNHWVVYFFIAFIFAISGIALKLGNEWSKVTLTSLDSRDNLALVLERRTIFNINQKLEKTYELLFVGDIMLSRLVGKEIEKSGDFKYPFLKIAREIQEADVAFGNLEGPISSRGKNQGSIYSFRARSEVLEGLKFAGFDILSLANNHIWDWGSESLEDTINILKRDRIKSVGAGENEAEANEPVIFYLDDIKIAYLAYTNLYPEGLEARGDGPGISDFDEEKIGEKIKNLKLNGVDIIIVSMHWGEEYKIESSNEQKIIARKLINAGVDLVIGHHPHVVQEIERYKNNWIAYSLGNFVFDQTFSKETMEGLMLKVFVKNGKIYKVEPVKIEISPNFQPYIIIN